MPDDDVLSRLKQALQDRYTIGRELGCGGMATVYLAQDLKHELREAAGSLAGTIRSGPQRIFGDCSASNARVTLACYCHIRKWVTVPDMHTHRMKRHRGALHIGLPGAQF